MAHGTRRSKRIARHRSHGARHALIDVATFRSLIADALAIINIPFDVAATQVGVGLIGRAQVVTAGVERWFVHFVVSKWHPTDFGWLLMVLATAVTVAISSGVAITTPCDQGWRKHGTVFFAFARRPAPTMTRVHPAAIVAGRKAPGFVIDPGPTPRADPIPVAEPIGRPIDGHALRHPERPVLRIDHPVAVAIQLFIADHIS